MAVNHDQLRALVSTLVEVQLAAICGDDTRPRLLLEFLTDLYGERPPESFAAPLTAFMSDEIPAVLREYPYLTQADGELGRLLVLPAVVQVAGPGTYRLWTELDLQSPTNGPDDFILYRLDDSEFFEARGQRVDVPNPYHHAKSALARPTFSSLKAALEHYARYHALNAVDPILCGCWVDSYRLRWKAAPEAALRDSLWYFLRDGIRGTGNPKREQNVDATHPVDIKVTWFYSKAVSLVEIKWLGCSFNDNGHCTASHGRPRAIEGAYQLRNYLDRVAAEDPDLEFVGHLVVFDGRRRNVTDFGAIPTPEDALAYECENVTYPQELIDDSRLDLHCRLYIRPRTETSAA